MSVNETVFKQLFVQLIELSLKQSVPDDSEIPQPDQELAFYRIERIGYQVGQRLVNRLIVGHRLFTDQLDILKYICKDYWLALFQKQIDNLKTNHKGVFVLQDNNFPWIAPFAPDISMPDTAKMAVLVKNHDYLAFPCGLLRGALFGLGIQATVTAEIPAFNQCSFEIRVHSIQK